MLCRPRLKSLISGSLEEPVIEAVKILPLKNGGIYPTGEEFYEKVFSESPGWIRESVKNRSISPNLSGSNRFVRWKIKTPHGYAEGNPHDWVVSAANGDLEVFSQPLFESRFETVFLNALPQLSQI